MKSCPTLLVVLGSLVTCLSNQAAVPATLTLQDLRDHPERWPTAVTVPRDLQFQGGAVVKKGEQVKLVELKGSEVVVDNRKGLVFGLPIAESDVVARANDAWSQLTPAQREITVATLAADRSLWPLRVQSFAEFRASGATIKAGRELELRSVTRDRVQLYAPEINSTLNTTVQGTDLIARARALALLPAAQRPSRVALAVKGQLTDATGKEIEPAGLEQAQVIALYYGASWCGPCRQFSPSLVKFVNRVMPENPHLAVVMLSNDKTDPPLYAYMRDEAMPWPVVTLSRVNKIPLLTGYVKNGIPQLVIVDRHGQVLADSSNLGPPAALQELEKILGTGAAK